MVDDEEKIQLRLENNRLRQTIKHRDEVIEVMEEELSKLGRVRTPSNDPSAKERDLSAQLLDLQIECDNKVLVISKQAAEIEKLKKEADLLERSNRELANRSIYNGENDDSSSSLVKAELLKTSEEDDELVRHEVSDVETLKKSIKTSAHDEKIGDEILRFVSSHLQAVFHEDYEPISEILEDAFKKSENLDSLVNMYNNLNANQKRILRGVSPNAESDSQSKILLKITALCSTIGENSLAGILVWVIECLIIEEFIWKHRLDVALKTNNSKSVFVWMLSSKLGRKNELFKFVLNSIFMGESCSEVDWSITEVQIFMDLMDSYEMTKEKKNELEDKFKSETPQQLSVS